jgi:hypothetical protein
MRTLFSPIHATVYRKGQYVTAEGKTGKVIGWRSRGCLGKMLLVQITGKSADSGKVYAFAARSVSPRAGNNGRGPLTRVA